MTLTTTLCPPPLLKRLLRRFKVKDILPPVPGLVAVGGIGSSNLRPSDETTRYMLGRVHNVEYLRQFSSRPLGRSALRRDQHSSILGGNAPRNPPAAACVVMAV